MRPNGKDGPAEVGCETFHMVRRREQPDAEVPEACESLRAMIRAPTTGSLQVLGAMVQTDGEHQLEYDADIKAGWAAYRS